MYDIFCHPPQQTRHFTGDASISGRSGSLWLRGRHTHAVMKQVWVFLQVECSTCNINTHWEPDTLPPRGSVPVLFYVPVKCCCCCWQVETLTVHTHCHCRLQRPEECCVLGMTCQLPPIVRAQSGDSFKDERRKKKKEKEIFEVFCIATRRLGRSPALYNNFKMQFVMWAERRRRLV